MKYYLDTNIWVAAFISKHPKHISSKELIADCLQQNIEIVTSAHCLAEVYSVLTKLPGAFRIPPEMAVKLIESNIINKCRLVDLTYTEYVEIINDAAYKNLVSGAIFDGLHVKAALKAEVNIIYTNNLGDFRRFDIPERIILSSPDLMH